MRLLTLGDSWTYGIELWDPELGPQKNYFPIHHAKHEAYRQRHAWPWKIAELLEVSEVINLAWPGCSNDTIVRRLMRWLTSEGSLNGRNSQDLLVMIGWTGPERRDFYSADAELVRNWPYTSDNGWITVTPWGTGTNRWSGEFGIKQLNTLSVEYFSHWCDPNEYLNRYINQTWTVQKTLDSIGAHWLMFQAFFENPELDIDCWTDEYFDMSKFQIDVDDLKLWNMVHSVNYYKKKDGTQTFHNFLMAARSERDDVMVKTHPTALGHSLWATELFNYMKNNKLV